MTFSPNKQQLNNKSEDNPPKLFTMRINNVTRAEEARGQIYPGQSSGLHSEPPHFLVIVRCSALVLCIFYNNSTTLDEHLYYLAALKIEVKPKV